jgi:protein-tyrosine phosphatase
MTSCRYDAKTYNQSAAKSALGFVPNGFGVSAGAVPLEGQSSMTSAHDTAEEILPRIFLGSAQVAKNWNWLKRNKITHILDVGQNNPLLFHKTINYLAVPLEDSVDEILTPALLNKCHQFIHQAQQNPRASILIHCFAGVSRSPTILASFLMRRNKWTIEKALSTIRDRRPVIRINPGFYKQLSEFRQ